jgi:hypothetical protein
LEGPCSSPDSNLESGNERCVLRTLIVGYLESGAPIIGRLIGIRDANGCQNRTVLDVRAQHQTRWNPGRQPSHTGGFPLLAALEAFAIGPMPADQHKQIGIR